MVWVSNDVSEYGSSFTHFAGPLHSPFQYETSYITRNFLVVIQILLLALTNPLLGFLDCLIFLTFFLLLPIFIVTFWWYLLLYLLNCLLRLNLCYHVLNCKEFFLLWIIFFMESSCFVVAMLFCLAPISYLLFGFLSDFHLRGFLQKAGSCQLSVHFWEWVTQDSLFTIEFVTW